MKDKKLVHELKRHLFHQKTRQIIQRRIAYLRKKIKELKGEVMEAPRYIHDCENCVFLGQHDEYDLYFCKQGCDADTVIARYGDEGARYTSGLPLARVLPELAEAKRRAIERGLLEEEVCQIQSDAVRSDLTNDKRIEMSTTVDKHNPS